MTNTVDFFRLSQNIGMTDIAPSIDLKDRVVVITGGANDYGIGGALTRSVLRFGGKVIAIGVQGDNLIKFENEFGSDLFAGIQCDFAKPISSSFKNVLAEVCDRFGHVDAVVLNSGVQKLYPWSVSKNILTTPADEVMDMIRINAVSHLDLFQMLYPYLEKSDAGRVLASSSSVVGRTDGKLSGYIISKTTFNAVLSLIQEQVKGTNILANVWAPPPVQSPLRGDYEVNEPKFANAQPADVIELAERLISASLPSDCNDRLYIFNDKRKPATTADNINFRFNERTANGLNFDIRLCSPIAAAHGTDGQTVIKDYDSWSSRKLNGYDPIAPIDQNTKLKDFLPTPASALQKRNSLLNTAEP